MFVLLFFFYKFSPLKRLVREKNFKRESRKICKKAHNAKRHGYPIPICVTEYEYVREAVRQ